MSIQITFQNCDSSLIMEQHIHEQLQKIVRFLETEGTPKYLEVFIRPGPTHAHHEIDFIVKTPRYHAVVKKEGPHIYQVLDEVIDTMYLQLHKEKDKQVEDRKMVGRHEEFKKQR